MHNYDFSGLNDKEFEVLVNDVLSKREGAPVDRYKPGKDGGVDGRFYAVGSEQVLVQSKHWIKSGITPLINALKKDELPKIRHLSPKRYILATSLPLSKAEKQKITSVLSPFILSDDDILGKENLNHYLSTYPEIEKNHYKLWLSSANVLDIMINAAITGRSEGKLRDIVDASDLYVVTENHDRALEKLENLHSIVITGEAGIGKTSLADQLAHHYVRHGFQLCVIADDISEAESVFKKGAKQVFYYDDFLGRNYLMAIEGNKDSHILSFMDRVSKDNEKRFILTSRSTVLNQGKILSDLLGIKKIDQKEYEITIQSLSYYDKGKILYNHLWHGDLAEDYIEQLYIGKRYLDVIKHNNYNPRLISFITDSSRIIQVTPSTYWSYIVKTLDNPEDIWAHVFDKQLDDCTRIAVCLTVFNGGKISQGKLFEAFIDCAVTDGLVTRMSVNTTFRAMMKAAVGSVLSRSLSHDGDENKSSIELFNPSITDFVLGRFLNDVDSLKTYFSALNTERALNNLESLRKSETLSPAAYSCILRELNKKITSDLLFQKTAYCLMLADMSVFHAECLTERSKQFILRIVRQVNDIPVPGDHIKETCNLLRFALENEPEQAKGSIVAFIGRCAHAGLNNDDFVNIAHLAEFPVYDDDEEVSGFIKEGVGEYWKDQIHEEVSHDGILDDYMDPENDYNYAYQRLLDYLSDKLKPFGFSFKEISDMADNLDITEYILENQHAAAKSDYYGSMGGADGTSQQDDALIIDLFDRA
ncbi:MAG: hypothetical protein EOM12_12925 [Verrucomicrobiae bacterium]|nr:hypothetical protein [Verrucomicrobiae bacterium]